MGPKHKIELFGAEIYSNPVVYDIAALKQLQHTSARHKRDQAAVDWSHSADFRRLNGLEAQNRTFWSWNLLKSSRLWHCCTKAVTTHERTAQERSSGGRFGMDPRMNLALKSNSKLKSTCSISKLLKHWYYNNVLSHLPSQLLSFSVTTDSPLIPHTPFC